MVICKSVFNSLQLTLPECVTSTGLWRFLVIYCLCKLPPLSKWNYSPSLSNSPEMTADHGPSFY